MTTQLRTAHQRRKQIRKNADALGIDDAYLSTLVETFYEGIGADERISHIFANKIGDDWEHHLAKMKDFWCSVAFNAGRYSGKPVPKHQALVETRPEHFEV
ncbi:group III truncated hemoglobin [uncultured Tateyamaria sp.]|uniref:group III truncated hemoglobin n=1 Tax=uncultured Tateyamaria sp. TaxID=455651 RepID=UPI00260FF7B6|nr:group III truncated hemoglobin [uncultured Tateyamaria sp.]